MARRAPVAPQAETTGMRAGPGLLPFRAFTSAARTRMCDCAPIDICDLGSTTPRASFVALYWPPGCIIFLLAGDRLARITVIRSARVGGGFVTCGGLI